MQEIAQLLIMLAAYYATFGIMAIGFGMMLGGSDGASAAGNFFFVRPVRAVLECSRAVLVGIAIAVSTAVIGAIKGWIVSEIKEAAKDARWLVTRRRGWLRGR